MSGAPTTGSFLTGDFCNDQAGYFWVCAAGGTPGTWVGAGSNVLGNLTVAGSIFSGGNLSVSGGLTSFGGYASQSLATPTGLTVTATGTTGSTYYGYEAAAIAGTLLPPRLPKC